MRAIYIYRLPTFIVDLVIVCSTAMTFSVRMHCEFVQGTEQNSNTTVAPAGAYVTSKSVGKMNLKKWNRSSRGVGGDQIVLTQGIVRPW